MTEEQRIMDATREYVDRQLVTMRQYGSAPTLTDQQYEKLIQDVAAYPLKLLRMRRRQRRTED